MPELCMLYRVFRPENRQLRSRPEFFIGPGLSAVAAGRAAQRLRNPAGNPSFLPGRGVAQSGRVLALGARCRWFESSLPDHPSPLRASGGLRHLKPLERRSVLRSPAGVGGLVCDHARRRMTMYYVYLIQSIKFSNQRYIGFTEDLKSRLKAHNAG